MPISGSMDFAPLYHKVRESLRQDMAAGVYARGDMLPSETALCEKYGVSRITIRRALGDLVSEGLLQRERGRGTYVTAPKIERTLSGDPSFARDMLRMGYTPGSSTLSAGNQVAEGRTRDLLGLGESEMVLRIDRVQAVNGEPVMRQQTLVPVRLLPQGFDPVAFSRAPLFVSLEQAGLVFTRMRTTVDPLALSPEDAELLKADVHSAGFYVEQVISTVAGPAVLNRSTIRGDRCRLVVDTALS